MSRLGVRAFTLIEVLISIVVLSLGLLGLAAIFPVVVYQQRMASDTVQGVSMANSAVAWLDGNLKLNKRGPFHDDFTLSGLGTQSNRFGWERLVCANTDFSRDGEWVPALPATNPAASSVFYMDANGVMTFTRGESDTYIPPAERVYPSPYAGMGFPYAAEPRYVWDLALRRLDAGKRHDANDVSTYYDDVVQAAVFVRRIDMGIRLPRDPATGRNFSLGEVLSGLAIPGLTPSGRRIPVAEDPQGRPTNDGIGGVGNATLPQYSPIRKFKFRGPANRSPDPAAGFNWVQIDPSYDPDPGRVSIRDARPYIAQVGQKFVDARGVIHTVTELVKDETTTPPNPIPLLRISPAMQWGDFDANANSGDAHYLELLYTPQVPVAIRIVTLGAGSGISPGAMP